MDKFREEIKKEMLSVSDKGRVLFAVLVCEKLYPNYMRFQDLNNWGDHNVLKESISIMHQYLFKPELFKTDEIKELIERIDLITPNTEEFTDITTSFALDACNSIYDTLNYLVDKDIEHVVDVATYARDTVDMFVQEKSDLKSNDPGLEIKIENDQFMIAEKMRQRKLLKRIRRIDFERLNDRVVDSLRDKQKIIDLDLLISK